MEGLCLLLFAVSSVFKGGGVCFIVIAEKELAAVDLQYIMLLGLKGGEM
jgi:hypothetical protein